MVPHVGDVCEGGELLAVWPQQHPPEKKREGPGHFSSEKVQPGRQYPFSSGSSHFGQERARGERFQYERTFPPSERKRGRNLFRYHRSSTRPWLSHLRPFSPLRESPLLPVFIRVPFSLSFSVSLGLSVTEEREREGTLQKLPYCQSLFREADVNALSHVYYTTHHTLST